MEKFYITLLPVYFQGKKLVDKGEIGGLTTSIDNIEEYFRFHHDGDVYLSIPARIIRDESNSQLFRIWE